MVKLFLGLMNNLAMKMDKEMKVLLHAFLTLAVVGGEWLASCPGHFNPKEGPQSPFCRGLDGFQSQSGHRGKEKSFDCARNGSQISWFSSCYPCLLW